jgi:hypothetical protein
MMGLLAPASVAVDGSKFKAVINRDKNFTGADIRTRLAFMPDAAAAAVPRAARIAVLRSPCLAACP